ncbi:hypothetical protein [Porphyromonas levii]|uniref:hypothetical protein n=1 Tax=Porphyromonas levii TaxID=28114 RepID=UPI001B8C0F57|nr:hypothetical protein [Porphyromonas levii]MBR8713337.1 hypothetical protein [Porphyromonas levii]MBR8715342.1 hypothetical protein [Porphyromonas levii]MBR8727868.1 hypothetical protein [Porphyromonas levii]MBR8730343.1 hypothetical protein [Porphyromonas levii]MBR8736205.1 hypothetical protein [Porphyromonas levii]
MKNQLFFAFAFLLQALLISSSGCGKKTQSQNEVILSEREEYRYDKTHSSVEELTLLLKESESTNSIESFQKFFEGWDSLDYSYNPEGMNSATIAHCENLIEQIRLLKENAKSIINSKISSSEKFYLVSNHNVLIESSKVFPIYLKQGEILSVDASVSESVTVVISNADLRKAIHTRKGKTINEEIDIDYDGIYLIEILATKPCRANIEIGLQTRNYDSITARPKLVSIEVACNKGDWGAKKVDTIKLKNIFEEPRKFTLRGQLKALFSGNSKATVPLSIPTGATDILYSLRISTSEQSIDSDGKFGDNLAYSYKKIKVLGLPLYEKEKRRGLLTTLLDGNRPIREEDAYCNLYLFRNQTQAKQFQDGLKKVSELDYDIDFSMVGTQSNNGQIPTQGANHLYLGFENERMRFTNYIWLEVVAIIPTTEYFATHYSIR